LIKAVVLLWVRGWLLCLVAGYASPAAADYLNEADQAPHEKCGYCHELDGNPRMTRYPRLAGQQRDYMVKQLKDFRSGRRTGEMQGTAELLSDRDIDIVSEYFSQQAVKLPQLDSQPGADQRLAKSLYQYGDSTRGLLACSACHGAVGLGGAAIPRLAGQHEAYLLQQLGEFKAGQRSNDVEAQMGDISRLLSDTEIAVLSAYLSRLKPNKNNSLKVLDERN
jgi:cytochrome c553